MKQFIVSLLLLSSSLLLGHGFAGNMLIKDHHGSWQDILQLSIRAKERDQFVLSYDVASKQYTYKKVSIGARAQTPCYVRLGFEETPDRDDILCTPTQAFYVTDGRQWVCAYQLKVGDELLSEQHQTKQLTRVTLMEEPLEVYSIEVADTHTFFVGGHAILTHNMFVLESAASYALAPTVAPLVWGALATPIAVFGPVPVFVVGGAASAALIGFAIKCVVDHGVRRYQLSYNTRSIAQSMRATALCCSVGDEKRDPEIPVCGTGEHLAKLYPPAPVRPCMNDVGPKETKGICGEQKMPEPPIPFCQCEMPPLLEVKVCELINTGSMQTHPLEQQRLLSSTAVEMPKFMSIAVEVDGETKNIEFEITPEVAAALGTIESTEIMKQLDALIKELMKITRNHKYGSINDNPDITAHQYRKLEDLAKRAWDLWRLSNEDIKQIAANTGIPIQILEIIKSHVFLEEHVLEGIEVPYVLERFAPDIDMYNAWQRLIDGTFVQSDLILLLHEYAESLIMQGTKVYYRSAHAIVDQIYNWKKAV